LLVEILEWNYLLHGRSSITLKCSSWSTSQ
jgi:hypothetical protein